MSVRHLVSASCGLLGAWIVSTIAPRVAHACGQPGDPCVQEPAAEKLAPPKTPDDSSSETSGVALGMDLTRSTLAGNSFGPAAPSLWGIRESMHGRAGRRVAFDLGVEQSFGGDGAGYRQYALGFDLPAMYFYLTPDSRFQVYTMTGMQLRFAHFETASPDVRSDGVPWMTAYLGAMLGAGVETRYDDKTAFRVEMRGFLRGRIEGAHENAQLAAANDTNRGVMFSVGVLFF